MSPQIQIDDAAIITEVAALGGYVPISRSGKWALVAQRLGLKAARAADVQKRYEMMLNDMPDDDDDEDDAGYGRRGLDESEEDLGNLPVLDGEEIVERIIGERVKSGFKQYMVKWANTDETTWEPAANLANCIDILDEWKRSEANKKARELAGPSRKRDVPEPEPVDERQRKRGASAQHVAQIEKDVVLTGLLEHDTIVSVRGPVNMSLQWIVSWRSGRMSVLTNAQCRAEASSALLDWYEGNLVIDQGAAPKKRSTTPTELVG